MVLSVSGNTESFSFFFFLAFIDLLVGEGWPCLLLGVRGQAAGVCSWFAPSTPWAQVIKLMPSDLASTFMLLSHLDGPIFKWNNFKSIVLLIINIF